jgi:hypothetical protein
MVERERPVVQEIDSEMYYRRIGRNGLRRGKKNVLAHK